MESVVGCSGGFVFVVVFALRFGCVRDVLCDVLWIRLSIVSSLLLVGFPKFLMVVFNSSVSSEDSDLLLLLLFDLLLVVGVGLTSMLLSLSSSLELSPIVSISSSALS